MKLGLSEIVLRYVFYIYWNFHLKVRSKINKDFDWHTEFELADEFVWFLAISQIFWSTIIIYPGMSVGALVMMYFHSKFLIYRL
mmetsp:Transcript_19398/g.29786  ORF Transcript_19398/g.29786 Transcript_19398/m.29786 type:complete len:84 (+) Transcript_19398:1871-2122(+)